MFQGNAINKSPSKTRNISSITNESPQIQGVSFHHPNFDDRIEADAKHHLVLTPTQSRLGKGDEIDWVHIFGSMVSSCILETAKRGVVAFERHGREGIAAHCRLLEG
eukprot:TRINITY_DN8297_c0_g1_i8.p1 TRINITY_DN8297_c0_g1~~TRINITY_DN8297_c0_g1_i8.p1  ORF type:complete len:107 (+),score=14.53 TRINITY_DN8297_c0_g1_i8:88-408(+)